MPESRFVLRYEAHDDGPLERLAARLPRSGIDGVLDDLDGTGRRVDLPEPAVVDAFAWAPADDADDGWFPQGVALAPDVAPGHDVLLVSWYGKRNRWGRTRGSRITVVDRTDPEEPRYRHVLLVDPGLRLVRVGRGRLALHRVPVHAGGIVVHGHRLLVADTFAGLRVFDLRDVVRVPGRRLDRWAPWRGAGTRTLGHRLAGFTAFGHGYVLPQRGTYRVRGGGLGRLRYSFAGLTGAAPRRLVVGEYGRKGQTTRLVEYPFDAGSGGPALDASGACAPLAVHDAQPHRMQGVAVVGDRWYLSASAGEGNPGTLWVGRPGAFRAHRRVLPTGPEDLDATADGDRLWCTTEWPGRRFTFAVDPSAWDA